MRKCINKKPSLSEVVKISKNADLSTKGMTDDELIKNLFPKFTFKAFKKI
ncbi:hypothetical protein [Clostridium psychrophilum]|nr:hypothetical protein [Clostridium psychrophilum]MBU3182971.1 hypothetical protein [Clostridium psychrophilum]